MVQRIARPLARKTTVPVGELVSAGYEAAVRAALLFDPAAGTPFLGYAVKTVQGRMLEAAFSPSLASKARRMLARNEHNKAQWAGHVDDEDESATLGQVLVGQLQSQVISVLSPSAGLQETPEEALASRQATQRALQVLQEVRATLKPQEQVLLQALYQDEATLEQAAERAQLSVATTRRLHAQLKLTLRKRLANRGVVELPPLP